MSWLEKIKIALVRFFQGRNGIDQLSLAAMVAALVLNLVDGFLGAGIFAVLSLALYVWAIFRMLSRNTARRAEENRRFTAWWYPTKTRVKQAWTRLIKMRKYKYFRCPECHAILRMKRGSGMMHVTCGKCKHQFQQRA